MTQAIEKHMIGLQHSGISIQEKATKHTQKNTRAPHKHAHGAHGEFLNWNGDGVHSPSACK